MRGLQKCVRNWNPDGFLSYLQDSTAKPAHLAALFYHVLLYPQKAILEIWITFYFCHHFLIIGYFNPGLFNYELFSSQDSTLMLKSAWLIRPELKLSVRNILQPIVSSRQKKTSSNVGIILCVIPTLYKHIMILQRSNYPSLLWGCLQEPQKQTVHLSDHYYYCKHSGQLLHCWAYFCSNLVI